MCKKSAQVMLAKLIQAYFDTRRKKTLDVNARYLVLLEASQFKCKQTLDFLYKINACEKKSKSENDGILCPATDGRISMAGKRKKGKKESFST